MDVEAGLVAESLERTCRAEDTLGTNQCAVVRIRWRTEKLNASKHGWQVQIRNSGTRAEGEVKVSINNGTVNLE